MRLSSCKSQTYKACCLCQNRIFASKGRRLVKNICSEPFSGLLKCAGRGPLICCQLAASCTVPQKTRQYKAWDDKEIMIDMGERAHLNRNHAQYAKCLIALKTQPKLKPSKPKQANQPISNNNNINKATSYVQQQHPLLTKRGFQKKKRPKPKLKKNESQPSVEGVNSITNVGLAVARRVKDLHKKLRLIKTKTLRGLSVKLLKPKAIY